MKQKPEKKSLKIIFSSNLHYIILLLLITFAFLLGSRMILHGDFFFLADQARDFLLAKDIVENNHITLIGTHSGLGGFFHGPLWLYMLVPFFLIGGGNPLAFTVLYIAIALATVIVGYFVAEKLYGKHVGLMTAFFLAITPAVWSYVPNTIGVNMVPIIFLGMFYFLIRFLRGDAWAFIYAIFFAGLSLQFETALPLIVIVVVALSFFLNKKAIRNGKLIVFSIVSFSLSVATFILFDLRHNFLMTNALLGFAAGGERQKGYMELFERIVSHGNSLKGVYISGLISEMNIVLLLLLAGSIGYGLYRLSRSKLFSKQEKREVLYLLLFPIAVFVFYLIYPYPVWPEYLLGLVIPVLLAYSVLFARILPEQTGKFLVIGFIAISLLLAGQKIVDSYLLSQYQPATAGSYRNQAAVVDWVIADARGESFGYFVYTPETYTYGMDYLFWYMGKEKGIPMPKSEKRSITYLVLYPALTNDLGAHAFWKKHKIRTASPVVATKEFQGGIVVEKLSVDPKEPSADPTYHQNLIFR